MVWHADGVGPAGSSQVGVSALGYPSGRAGPPDSSAYGGSYLSTSLATGIAEARGVYAI